MRHLNKTMLHGSTVLTLKGEEDDPADLVTKAIGDLTKTIETRLGNFETRMDKIEAKANRPDPGKQKAEDEPSIERKAFGAYLFRGDAISEEDKKALTVSSNPDGGYLAPPELSSEIIRELVEYNPIRAYASVRGTTMPGVVYGTRGDLTWTAPASPRSYRRWMHWGRRSRRS